VHCFRSNWTDVSSGSWSCENDFGPPKSPSDGRRIAQDGRTEHFFSGRALQVVAAGRRHESTSGLPDGPCEPLPARRTYPVIASMSFPTPTMLSTRVRL
jgi:hypothetical protein